MTRAINSRTASALSEASTVRVTESPESQNTGTDLSWLELVPEDCLPPNYVDVVKAEAVSKARRSTVHGHMAEVSARLIEDLADEDADPLRASDTAMKLAGLRLLVEHLPPPVLIPLAIHQQLVDNLYRSLNVESLTLGPPPAPFAERAHFAQYHAGEHLPPITEYEHEVMDMFETVSKESAKQFLGFAAMRLPLTPGEAVENRVRAWHALSTDDLPQLDATFATMRRVVDRANTDRWAGPNVHRCPLQNGGRRFLLRPVPFGPDAWTGKDARNYGFVNALVGAS
ncbi:MAG: hypothetical protein JWN95_299 [Frankiales bacterium]|nr:hypothetical protein [Frankiales bacterium]